jgi:hypothetical protein
MTDSEIAPANEKAVQGYKRGDVHMRLCDLSERENSPYPTAFLNASGGEVLASSSQSWRIVLAIAPLLTNPLTVAVHPFKKPCIYNGFNSLNTDGRG